MKGREDDSDSTERDDFSLGLRAIAAILYQFSCQTYKKLFTMWVHRDFYSFILVHQFSILNGVIPENISTNCPLRDSDDNFTRSYSLFVYVIVWARGQLRINFTRFFKVFTKLPEPRSEEGNLENFEIQVKLILNCPRALAITYLSHKGQNY